VCRCRQVVETSAASAVRNALLQWGNAGGNTQNARRVLNAKRFGANKCAPCVVATHHVAGVQAGEPQLRQVVWAV